MARTRHLALMAGTAVVALSVAACSSSKEPLTITGGTSTSSTTTTVVGAGPAVRVPANDPASLGRLFAAWTIPQGSDGYIGPCAADPASMTPADTWCSVETTGAEGGQVFRMFHPGDVAATAAVLVAPSDGFYRIEDSFTFGEGTPPSWVGATA